MGQDSSKSGALTDDERQRVISSWEVIAQNPEENGIFIFKTFMEKYQYYGFFKKFDGIPINELPENKTFRKHSLSIVQSINNVISHLNDDTKLKTDLNELAKLHRYKNVTPKQFMELKMVILDSLAKVFKLPPETLLAWNKALDVSFVQVFEVLTASGSK